MSARVLSTCFLVLALGAAVGFVIGRVIFDERRTSQRAGSTAQGDADDPASDRARRMLAREGLSGPRMRRAPAVPGESELVGEMLAQDEDAARAWPRNFDRLLQRLFDRAAGADRSRRPMVECVTSGQAIGAVRLQLDLDGDEHQLQASNPRVLSTALSAAERACIEHQLGAETILHAVDTAGPLPVLHASIILVVPLDPRPGLDAWIDAGVALDAAAALDAGGDAAP